MAKQLIQMMVGKGCPNKQQDVRAVQSLLYAAGNRSISMDGKWGPASSQALTQFQEANAKVLKQGIRPFVAPLETGDNCALVMAWRANLLVRIGGKGIPGFLQTHDWLVRANCWYSLKHAPAIYGIVGQGKLGIQHFVGRRSYPPNPIAPVLNCTTYVNLMLGVLLAGSLSSDTYKPFCNFGGTGKEQGSLGKHLAAEQYKLQRLMNGKTETFESAKEILRATGSSTGTAYAIEREKPDKGVTHMGILVGETVYESTGATSSAYSKGGVSSKPLGDFVGNRSEEIVYHLFGPAV